MCEEEEDEDRRKWERDSLDEGQEGRAVQAKLHFKQFTLGIPQTHTHISASVTRCAPSCGE